MDPINNVPALPDSYLQAASVNRFIITDHRHCKIHATETQQ